MVLPLLVLAAISNTSGPSFSVGGWPAAVIIAAAVVTGIVTLWKFVWPALNKLVDAVNAWPGIQENAKHAEELAAVAQLAPLVHKIAGQFDNNGGSSLRDAVDENTRLTKRALETSTQAFTFAQAAATKAEEAAAAAAKAAEAAAALANSSSQP